jgi:hypothetical protein
VKVCRLGEIFSLLDALLGKGQRAEAAAADTKLSFRVCINLPRSSLEQINKVFSVYSAFGVSERVGEFSWVNKMEI